MEIVSWTKHRESTAKNMHGAEMPFRNYVLIQIERMKVGVEEMLLPKRWHSIFDDFYAHFA